MGRLSSFSRAGIPYAVMQCPGFETAHSLLSPFLSFLHCPITIKAKSPPKYAKKRAMETIKTMAGHMICTII